MYLRVLRALIRWLVSFNNLGFISTFKIIWFRVFRVKPDVLVECSSKKFGKFRWNAKRDWTIGHFFTPQIEIFSPKADLEVETIVDLGANIGTETLRLAKLYPSARVFAVEAVRKNFEILEFNTRQLSSVTAIFGAIWSSPAKLKLVGVPGDSQSWSLEEVRGDEFDIKGMMFEDILVENDIREIDILKVDIEGAERELFSHSCLTWIERVKCIIMETPDYDSPLSTQEIYRVFDAANYKFNTYVHGENLVFVRSDMDWKPRTIEIY